MVVIIPKDYEHNGDQSNLIKVEIPDTCPKCGGPRATARTYQGPTFHGRLWLTVDYWDNVCGHIDFIMDIRKTGTPVPWNTPSIND